MTFTLAVCKLGPGGKNAGALVALLAVVRETNNMKCVDGCKQGGANTLKKV